MRIIGLTGSIGMGKSATAEIFRTLGVPVHDSDAVVHELYRGEAARLIEAAFPGSTGAAGVDRGKLSSMTLGNPEALKRLEAIVHPLVRAREEQFLQAARQAGSRLVVKDVPLLFETGGAARADIVIVVSAPEAVQRQRVLARPGMTAARLAQILARQMPDAEKRRRAHAVIETSRGAADAGRQVGDLLKALAGG